MFQLRQGVLPTQLLLFPLNFFPSSLQDAAAGLVQLIWWVELTVSYKRFFLFITQLRLNLQ